MNLCWIIFFCAPALNIFCSNDGKNMSYHTMNYFELNDHKTLINAKPAYWYNNIDYSDREFIFEKWFGRETMENAIWTLDNFPILIFNKLNTYFQSMYKNDVNYTIYIETNHIWIFAVSCLMSLINYGLIWIILRIFSSRFSNLRTDLQIYVISNISKAFILSSLIVYFFPVIKTIFYEYSNHQDRKY